jgi:hypothetical protein
MTEFPRRGMIVIMVLGGELRKARAEMISFENKSRISFFLSISDKKK